MVGKGQRAETIFSSLYPLLYAANSPADGCYERIAETIAVLADSHSEGIRDKTVLDIGCGFGTTAMAVSAYAPKKIIAVDNSAGMVELLKTTLLTQRDLHAWIGEKEGAKRVLGKFYQRTLDHLFAMRETFQNGIFLRRGGEFVAVRADGLEVDQLGLGEVDIIIGSNYLHWPVEKLLTEGASLKAACRNALLPLARVLKRGGTMVLMEGDYFVEFDDSPMDESDFSGNAEADHPVHLKSHQILNSILKSEYGIQRDIPRRTRLFPRSLLAELFAEGGFLLKRFHHFERTSPGVLDSVFLSFPMMVGEIDLPFEVKMKLGRRVYSKLVASVTSEELVRPQRAQYFFQVFERA